MTNTERNESRTRDAFLDQVAAKREGYEFTIRELHAAFDRVKNPENWKYPINAEITTASEEEASRREIVAIREAVAFMAGCLPEIRHLGNFRFRVTAVGYYNAVGA